MSQIKQTPQSSYTGPIVVDPLTRIEGHLKAAKSRTPVAAAHFTVALKSS